MHIIKQIWLLLFLLLCSTTKIYGQSDASFKSPFMIWTSFNKIVIDEQLLKFKDSRHLFEKVPLAFDQYNKAIGALKTSNFLGWTALLCIPIGLLIIDADTDPRASGTTYFGAGVILFGTPIFGLSALIIKSNSKFRQQDAVDLYNEQINNPQKVSMQVSVARTNNGVGFVLNF